MPFHNPFIKDGRITFPEGASLVRHVERWAKVRGDKLAYRFLDFSTERDGVERNLHWADFSTRNRAIGARLQQVTEPGERVAILCPQNLDYLVAFFGTLYSGRIAVPLFDPGEPGHVGGGVALGEVVLQRRDPHHEELVEVPGHDAGELQPLEERVRGVAGLLEHPAVELEPAELAVEDRPTLVTRRPTTAAVRDAGTGSGADGGHGSSWNPRAPALGATTSQLPGPGTDLENPTIRLR